MFYHLLRKKGTYIFSTRETVYMGLIKLKENDNNYMANLLTEMASEYKSFRNITRSSQSE